MTEKKDWIARSIEETPEQRALLLQDLVDFIVTNQNGGAFPSPNTLQTRSSKFLKEMADAGRVKPGLTLHGLRHTIGKAVAESGGSLRAIQGALQHKSTRMALYYSEHADRKRALLDSAPALDNWFDLQSTPNGVSKGTDQSDSKVLK